MSVTLQTRGWIVTKTPGGY